MLLRRGEKREDHNVMEQYMKFARPNERASIHIKLLLGSQRGSRVAIGSVVARIHSTLLPLPCTCASTCAYGSIERLGVHYSCQPATCVSPSSPYAAGLYVESWGRSPRHPWLPSLLNLTVPVLATRWHKHGKLLVGMTMNLCPFSISSTVVLKLRRPTTL